MSEQPIEKNDERHDGTNRAEEARADAKESYEAPQVKSLKLSKEAAEALT